MGCKKFGEQFYHGTVSRSGDENMITDPYKILGIDRNASDEEVKKAYRRLSRQYHPDANVGAPNQEQIEETFKEIQQAYRQIMDEREHAGRTSYGGADAYGNYRTGRQSSTNYQYSGEDSLKMQAAANYINNRHFSEALNVLSAVCTKTAQWYYFSAMANAGMGNNINAQNLAQQAVALEPENIEYRQFLQQLQFGGTWYHSMGESYGRPAESHNLCLNLCMLNLFCNCCCRPF